MKKALVRSIALLMAARYAVASFSDTLAGKYGMKKAPLFLAAALLVGSALLVPLAPVYATPDTIPVQAAAGQLSDNQTAPSATATAATTDTTQATVVVATPTPAPATIIAVTTTPTAAAISSTPALAADTTQATVVVATPTPASATITAATATPTIATVTAMPTPAATVAAASPVSLPRPHPASTYATPHSIPGQAAAGQFSDNQTAPSITATEPPAPPPPPPAPATITTAPTLPVTTAPSGPTTSASTAPAAPAPAVTVPTPPAASNVLPPITQAPGTQPGLSFTPAEPGTLPPRHHFPPSSDNGTAHHPPFPPDGHRPPFTPPPLPPQTYPTYPTYPYYSYDTEYTLPIYAPVIGSFTANPYSIQPGQAATLSWDVSNASAISISPTVGSVPNTGSLVVMPTDTTTYTLYAYSSQGTVSAGTTVTVTPYVSPYGGTYGTAVISYFTANPNYVQPGQAATLSWTVNSADTVTLSPLVGPVANTGSFDVTPTQTTTYALSAYNGAGTVSASTTVTVAPNVNSYVSPAYAIGNGINAATGSAGTASGSMVNTAGASNSSTTAVNLWPMYLLLIGLLAVASVVIIALLVRKPAVANAGSTGTSTGYLAPSTVPAATLPAIGTFVTTPVEAGLPAKFALPGGTTIPVTGRPLGRRDFQALTPPEKVAFISRQHILVTYENSQYQIEDLGSTNGTKLNGSEIRGDGRHVLENGDMIELAGKVSITFKA